MDRSLDEILAARDDRKGGRPRGRGGHGGQRRREPREDFPRDGVRKSYRDDAPRNLDSEWVHDRFEENGRKPRQSRRGPERDEPDDLAELNGTKIRVENVHYELSREDLAGLFNQIGPVQKLDVGYDRAGRSTGVAYVTYDSYHDAREAIREFDGANAHGQPIRLSIVPPRRQRNPFDNAVMPGRPLAERVTVPPGRNRSISPDRDLEDEAARKGIDRYVPGGRRNRSRSPMRGRRREGGRRPGARRGESGAGGRDGGERKARDGRPKKTQEELDAEMEDYFGGGGDAQPASNNNSQAAAAQAAEDDIDMIE
ncbi:hypothetical protein KVR01_004984 [Diaporthe batatas]|uniref:uncharacterized protein n=1 Tax=Diaporthe batatas TaxID=748121 RepID=UPI001D05B1DC|nr:uncharacterized protein KVR01_004984 [Diaporthe batatas]KAG8164709.1 hypothetical protein KVR01_004984 [Diaporthe batatas]